MGIHRLTGEKVAIKVFEKSKIAAHGDHERVGREIKILKRIKHPNIIQLYEIIETSSKIYMIMEYAEGGELFNHIVQVKRLSEPKANRLF